MKTKWTWLVLSLVATSGISAEETKANDPVAELIALSKFTGGCGILSLQGQFQENTKLEGGEQFMFRFWSTEATRIGLTLEKYVEQCKKSGELLKVYQDALNSPDPGK